MLMNGVPSLAEELIRFERRRPENGLAPRLVTQCRSTLDMANVREALGLDPDNGWTVFEGDPRVAVPDSTALDWVQGKTHCFVVE